jgi:hypothetical protein
MGDAPRSSALLDPGEDLPAGRAGVLDADRFTTLAVLLPCGRSGRASSPGRAPVTRCEGETAIQLKWLRARIKQAAPQAVVVAD